MKKIALICLLILSQITPSTVLCINLFKSKTQVNIATLAISTAIGLILGNEFYNKEKFAFEVKQYYYKSQDELSASRLKSNALGILITSLYLGLPFKLIADRYLRYKHPEEVLKNIHNDLNKIDNELLEIIKLSDKSRNKDKFINRLEYKYNYWWTDVPLYLGYNCVKNIQLKLVSCKMKLRNAKRDKNCTLEIKHQIHLTQNHINSILKLIKNALEIIQNNQDFRYQKIKAITRI